MSIEPTPAGLAADRERIDQQCDDFEAAWLRDEKPRIGDFVERCEKAHQAELFYELLLVELEYRRRQGEQAVPEDYLKAFPQFATQISSASFRQRESVLATSVGADDDTVRIGIPQAGGRIKHFELLERLGAGAMGEVWKAWDMRLRRPVAIKLPRTQSLSEGDLSRFVREGQAAAQLRHPQLASVYEAGRVNETAYIVADYVEGENLRNYLVTNRLEHAAAAELCAQIAEALHHAHEQGVVHRDLKPANIIVDAEGLPHVIDFGLAKWASDDNDLTQRGELLGTPAYMSPEQAGGDGLDASPRTDVYSLGVILYEMLTGRCPFLGNRGSVIHQILVRVETPPRSIDPKVPRDLETICIKALEKDPARRYATAQEMAVDLRRFVRGEPILARRVGPLEKSWRWLRKSPAAAAAFLLAITAVGAIVLAGSFAKENRELHGVRTITIKTNPPGAKLAFARLGALGELLPDQIIKPGGTTPVQADFLPGYYFVEAVWPDGSFHQVIRRVPGANDSADLTRERHSLWAIAQDGTITLPQITIPPSDVTNGMKLTSMNGGVVGAVAEDKATALQFYVDQQDVTFGQLPNVPGMPHGPAAEPLKLQFDQAAWIAEALGKRLPTSLEYRRLLQSSGLQDESNKPMDIARQESPTEQTENLAYRPGVDQYSGFRCVRSTRPRFLEAPESD